MIKSRHSNINHNQEFGRGEKDKWSKKYPFKYKTKIKGCENYGYKIEY